MAFLSTATADLESMLNSMADDPLASFAASAEAKASTSAANDL